MATNVDDETSANSTDDLWKLKCRDLRSILKTHEESTSGNKSSLVARVHALQSRQSHRQRIETRVPISNSGNGDCEDVDFSKGATYQDLLRLAGARQWTSDLRCMPEINFHQLYDYLVLQTKKYGDVIMKGTTYKKERAFAFFREGHITGIQIARSEGRVWVQARILASMKKVRYRVMTVFSDSGDVIYASCECPAGLGVGGAGKCNHVGGLLFCVEEVSKRGIKSYPERVSCTSKLSGWVVPRNLTVQAKPIEELNIRKVQFGKKNDGPVSSNYDPRAPNDRFLDVHSTKTLYDNLQDCLPSSGFFLFHPSHDNYATPETLQEPDFTDCLESQCVAEDVSVLASCAVHPTCPKVTVSEPKINLFSQCTVIESFDSNISDEFDINSTVVSSHVKKFMSQDVLSDEVIESVEVNTREQSNSDLWSDLHKVKLTASNFGRAVTCSKNPDKLLKSILYTDLNLPSLDYGHDHEQDAIDAYVKYKAKRGAIVTVEKAGLLLCKERPGYGASLDGRIFDTVIQSTGGLECKCPSGKVGLTAEKACERDKRFYLVKSPDGKLCLKKSHNYYVQIQGQMYITGLKWTDFVVWFGHDDVFVERIYFDSASWFSKLLPALDYFYEKAFVPELLTKRVKRGLELYKQDQWKSHVQSIKKA